MKPIKSATTDNSSHYIESSMSLVIHPHLWMLTHCGLVMPYKADTKPLSAPTWTYHILLEPCGIFLSRISLGVLKKSTSKMSLKITHLKQDNENMLIFLECLLVIWAYIPPEFRQFPTRSHGDEYNRVCMKTIKVFMSKYSQNLSRTYIM